MAYGDKRDYPKIDIYLRVEGEHGLENEYQCSTTWAKTCTEARLRWQAENRDKRGFLRDLEDIRANFAK